MKRKYLAISLILGFVVFIGIAIITKLFSSADLPVQISGALLEAVVTAFITYFLLTGQTSQEEVKERNVRVFEEKSERFNTFINKLWEIWDDRVVSLEELNELIKLVSKDIVLYTKPETVDKILQYLIEIAEQAKPDKTTKDAETTKKIQENIFNIINELAKEIGLGGEIKPEIRDKLNTLESKVVPYLIQKDFKKNYLQSFEKTLENTEEELDISKVDFKNNYLWCQIKNSNVYLKIGPLERDKSQSIFVGVYVEFWNNRNFQKYRDAARGWRKDYIRGMYTWLPANFSVNFSDYQFIEEQYYKMSIEKDIKNELAEKIIQLHKTWKIEGKSIDEIIEECTSKI